MNIHCIPTVLAIKIFILSYLVCFQIYLLKAGLLIIRVAVQVWSHVEVEVEDYFFPLEPVINFCKLADECQHDFVPVCAQDSLGITRMFNDVCDSYEYNCDENKQYRHVQMKMCNYEFIPAPYEWGNMGKK